MIDFLYALALVFLSFVLSWIVVEVTVPLIYAAAQLIAEIILSLFRNRNRQ